MAEVQAQQPSVRLAFDLLCPQCGIELICEESAAACEMCGRFYSRTNGVWRFISSDRLDRLTPFLDNYRIVRRDEGWGSDDPEYYRSLPVVAESDPQHAIWTIREKSFETLVQSVIEPMERSRGRRLKILDVGAGNGWLAARLAQRGHWPAAIDISVDDRDGLGVGAFDEELDRFQAEMNRLPLASYQADLIIFNGSIHYSEIVSRTLREALRVARIDGLVVVMDSPVYHSAASGRKMLAERADQYSARYGFPAGERAGEGFLTYGRLKAIERDLSIQWRFVWPRLSAKLSIGSCLARVKGEREHARFPVIIGRRRI